MIHFDDAYAKVLGCSADFGYEEIPLSQSNGRVLAEDILADRDFPPFDRATKDGIALNYTAIEKGLDRLAIAAVISAGMPQATLDHTDHCVEIMTGAVIPHNADTVIMYEQLDIVDGMATLSQKPTQGQNIHRKGSDVVMGSVLLEKGTRINAAGIGVLASVGKSKVRVKRVPKICVISTGNELVDIDELPLPHQIRKSNSLSLVATLENEHIMADTLHLVDDQEAIQEALAKALDLYDVLLLSGGVSKGKFDFIPDALNAYSGFKKSSIGWPNALENLFGLGFRKTRRP